MSYSNQMIVHAVDTMESYLNNKLPETKLWEHSFIKKQIDRREYQENFTIEDHIRGMVYSMLSSGAKWDRVVDGIDDSTGKITPIDELFHNYNMEYILSSSSDFFTERIKEICGATQSTRKQMEALIKNNIPLLSKIENQYGSIDSCYKKYIAEDSTLKGLIEKLSSPESFFKMNQMGEALNAEYLRNVGYDIAKPDRHIRRILGSKILGCSKYETVPIYEAMDIIQSIAEQMGKHCAEVDYLLWMYCANGYGEVYDYLCCSEKELEKTHMISTDYVYPSCQSENLNYYQLNGMYYDTYEPGILREVIDRSIESQEAYTVFKMSDDAVYQDVVDEMHETLMEEGAGYLGELYGLWQVSYSYSEEASLNKFIIYWFYE